MQEDINLNNKKDEMEKTTLGQEQNNKINPDYTIDSIEKAENKFDQNMESFGGPEGVKKVWSEIDEAKKQEILTKIEEFSQKRKEAIDEQAAGGYILSPARAFENLDEGALGYIVAFLMYFTGITESFGVAFLSKGTFDRVKNAIKLRKENSKLKKLEGQYS